MLIITIFAVFYSLGIGFGKAVVNTVKGVRDAKKEWKKDNIDPIDTIKSLIIKINEDSSINSGI